MAWSSEIERARRLLAGAPRVLVLTGAGLSAESGVPTFRGPGGLWREFRPEELATPEAFGRDPRLVWEWYGWRRGVVAACAPNAGHLALARWAQGRTGVTIVTQNVDALQERANRLAGPASPGASLGDPIRLHGSIVHARCTRCPHREAALGPVDASSAATLPRCPACGAMLRPDVVWFGEGLPAAALAAAEEAARLARACLVVGTAGAVYPAAELAFSAARDGQPLIVVDPAETAYDQVATVKLSGPAGQLLPLVLA